MEASVGKVSVWELGVLAAEAADLDTGWPMIVNGATVEDRGRWNWYNRAYHSVLSAGGRDSGVQGFERCAVSDSRVEQRKLLRSGGAA